MYDFISMLRLIFLLLLPFSISGQLKRYQFMQNKMGSPFNIIFYSSDSAEATKLAIECYLLIDSLNIIFSDYSNSSEVGMLADKPFIQSQNISDELFEMILQSKQAWKKSGKTFDITIGPLSQLWRNTKKVQKDSLGENRFPAKEEIKKVKQATGFKNLVINHAEKTISYKKPGMRFDFGGFVKGYAAQKVIDHLKSKSIFIALADAGGDIAMSESPPGKKGWSIGINLPEQENKRWDQQLELKNCAVATSGDVFRYTLHNGKKYSHIIDPRTGYGVTSQRNVTVIAKDGAKADWLATACSILPIKKALKLAKKENSALFIAILKNEKIILYKTENFDQYFQKKAP